MAQTIAKITPRQRISIGGRFQVTAEIELGTEYLLGGYELTVAQLQEMGLVVGQVYSGYVNAVGATNAAALGQLVIDKPDNEAQKVKLVFYVLGTATIGKPFKEPADKNGELSGTKYIVTLTGE